MTNTESALDIDLRLGYIFPISDHTKGKITEMHSNGVMYHTLDLENNCIAGQQYITIAEFNKKFKSIKDKKWKQ